MKINTLHKIAFTAFGLVLGAVSVSAQEATYGPYDGSQKLSYFGTGKKENYDVAIHLTNSALVGKTVKGIVIPMNSDITGIDSTAVAFMSKTLTIKNKVNVPDIESDTASISGGKVTIRFKQPYTITSDGVYVGYSLSLNAKSTAVIPVVVANNPDDDNLYMHTTSTYRKWGSRASTLGCELALEVLLDGIEPDVATVVSGGDVNTQIILSKDYTFSVKNGGSTAISSVDFSYSLAGVSNNVHADLADPVKAHVGSTGSVSFAIPAVADAGTYPLTVSLLKVNGKDVAPSSFTSNVNVYKLLPTKRALLEEYTGTWCGYCPRGFVGLEHMNELYGNDFVGVSYHNGDPMEFTSSFPSSVPGFPDAWIDRSKETDAYCGDNYDGHFNIDKTYAECNKQFAPADLVTRAYFTDATQSSVEVKTSVTFAGDNSDNPYQLAYILTADGLSEAGDTAHQSSWDQSNYYSGETTYPDDDMKEFVNGGSTISGLTFNFVVCGWSGKSYIDGSLPSSVVAMQPVNYTYTFDLAQSLNASGNAIIQDKSKLHVVTLLIDTTTGHVVNALKSNVYSDEAAGIKGIDDANADATAVAREYYSIDGKRLCQPQKGLNIVRLSNGKTFKVVVK